MRIKSTTFLSQVHLLRAVVLIENLFDNSILDGKTVFVSNPISESALNHEDSYKRLRPWCFCVSSLVSCCEQFPLRLKHSVLKERSSRKKVSNSK